MRVDQQPERMAEVLAIEQFFRQRERRPGRAGGINTPDHVLDSQPQHPFPVDLHDRNALRPDRRVGAAPDAAVEPAHALPAHRTRT